MKTIFRRVIRLIEEHIKLWFTFDELSPDNIEEFEIGGLGIHLTKEISNMETVWKLFEKTHKNLVLTNYLEIRILELEKVKNTYLQNKNNKKAQWMLFLDDPNFNNV